MSLLTEAVIHVMSCTRERLKELQQPIPSDDTRHQFFVTEALQKFDTEQSGGRKVFCNSILTACFNYVSPHELLEWLKSFKWTDGDVIVMSIDSLEFDHRSVTWVDGETINTKFLYKD